VLHLRFEVILGAGGTWQAEFQIMKHENRIVACVEAVPGPVRWTLTF
jgi:hypothetical protein